MVIPQYPVASEIKSRRGAHPGGTLNGNPLSACAALATLSELRKTGVYEHVYDIIDKLIVRVERTGSAV